STSASASSTISYTGAVPIVTLSGPSSANEGDVKHYTFTTVDGNPNVTFSLVAVSGGVVGTVSNLQFNSATGSGSFDVTFSDGGANPTMSTVSVQVQDSAGVLSNVSTINVAVSNVAPLNLSVSVSANKINEGGSITLTGSFGDPGKLDTHKVIIN